MKKFILVALFILLQGCIAYGVSVGPSEAIRIMEHKGNFPNQSSNASHNDDLPFCARDEHPVHEGIMGCITKSPSEVVTLKNANDQSHGVCLLSLAWNNNRKDYFEELLKKGANPDNCGRNFSLSLYEDIALRSCPGRSLPSFDGVNSIDTGFQFLEKNGIISNNQKLLFAVLRSISIGCEQSLEAVINRGVDVNAKDEYGRLPLDFVVVSPEPKYLKMTKQLISAGANPYLTNGRGESALQIVDRLSIKPGNWNLMKKTLSAAP